MLHCCDSHSAGASFTTSEVVAGPAGINHPIIGIDRIVPPRARAVVACTRQRARTQVSTGAADRDQRHMRISLVGRQIEPWSGKRFEVESNAAVGSGCPPGNLALEYIRIPAGGS